MTYFQDLMSLGEVELDDDLFEQAIDICYISTDSWRCNTICILANPEGIISKIHKKKNQYRKKIPQICLISDYVEIEKWTCLAC